METMVRIYTDALMYVEEADQLTDDGSYVVACVSHRKGIVDLVWWFLPGFFRQGKGRVGEAVAQRVSSESRNC